MNHYTNTENPIDFPKSALKHAKGNLLDLAEAGEFDIIIHGCNCFNTMGGGIAREIRERYPEVSTVDSKTVSGDYSKLGNWTKETVIRKNGSVEFIVITLFSFIIKESHFWISFTNLSGDTSAHGIETITSMNDNIKLALFR